MIADIYYCPQCAKNVYLSKDETQCPICQKTDLEAMKVVELGVDLEQDYAVREIDIDDEFSDEDIDVEPKYANGQHLDSMLSLRIKDDLEIYSQDCWHYAWDPKKTDLFNLENLNAFLDNPNKYLSKFKEPMDYDTLKSEIERLLMLAITKADRPKTDKEYWDALYSTTDCSPNIRIYVSNDLTSVKASACYSSNDYWVKVYAPVEEDNIPPINTEGYRVFPCLFIRIWEDMYKIKNGVIPKRVRNTAIGIAKSCIPQPKTTWKEYFFKLFKNKQDL